MHSIFQTQSPTSKLPNAIYEGELGFRRCSITVMDTTSGCIDFNEEGVSNFYTEFIDLQGEYFFRTKESKEKELAEIVAEIKARKPKNSKYDAILGLSGGVDSSYLAYLCKELGLNPLCVHFDYGWNSEIAVQNIHNIIEYTGFHLETFVIDWENFKRIQRAYFKAGVLDLDVPADHLIFGALYDVANKYNLYTVLNGYNLANESILPPDWCFNKADYSNLIHIGNTFEKIDWKTIPTFSPYKRYYYALHKQLKSFALLNAIPYSKASAISEMELKMGWKYYGGKHFETIFTRWYQGCYLPKVYGIDKRKAHLSSQIINGEITRDQALEELKTAIAYPLEMQMQDCVYVAKKWELTESEFIALFLSPKQDHKQYKLDVAVRNSIPYKLFRYAIKASSYLLPK